MLALRSMQEGPNTDLSWLFYALIGFLVLVIAAGAWVSRDKTQSASKRKLPEKTAKSSARRKTK
ncbi:MAG TPA: hypothetical protein VHM28_08750 [Anaerolineales bacterium]|nr:hypothetical protein [Anaerolineales bacterium]